MPDTAFKVVIPARYASTRLPGKPLADIGGKPLIRHVYEAARSSGAETVIVATDDQRIHDAAVGFGARVIMTSSQHASGTERVAEVVTRLDERDDAVIVNVQGDEYGLAPALIDQAAGLLAANSNKSMATLCEPIVTGAELGDPHVVKVVMNHAAEAIYFSRAPIPSGCMDAGAGDARCVAYRHLGIYAYRAGFLRKFAEMPPCPLELSERLEQLRALYYGFPILVAPACATGAIGVDSVEDLERARRVETVRG
jgi:3-deoxy-manno-octulosonate cytidylyltransferase (CMP-KDO synthetase)